MVKECPFDIIPCISIHPDRINLYNQLHWHSHKRRAPKVNHLISSDSKHHGIVSAQARRKVSRAIEYLLFMANNKYLPVSAPGSVYNFKIAFLTLTLPSRQVHSDLIIKNQCFNHFLVEIRKYYNVKNYVWRAERQKNGNIHFHILIDKFIPWSELRNRWNRIINKLGYVERYRNEIRKYYSNGFKVRQDLLKNWSYKAQLKAYNINKINDWHSPNSTDIHSLRKVKKIKSYITKYTCKDETNSEIIGKMWGCNFELSHIKGAQSICDSHINDELRQLIKENHSRVYASEYFSVIDVSFLSISQSKFPILYMLFIKYLSTHFKTDIQSIIALS